MRHVVKSETDFRPMDKTADSIAMEVRKRRHRVFVSGCYDLLHSGHIEFFKQASQYGDLYVGIGSDATYLEYKHAKPLFPQEERLFMVKAVRYVKDACINEGVGIIDFLPTLDKVKPDVFVVNSDGGSEEKRRICRERGIRYVELERAPHAGLQARSSSSLKAGLAERDAHREPDCTDGIPTRLDIAGTWIDQPYVSVYHPGWALTVSLEPTFEVRDRCGLSTSTRNTIRKIWPYSLPKMAPEMLARLVFCFENTPEREAGDHVSGAQDAIGICVPGLSRHYYDNRFWPDKIESTTDEMTLRFLEDHLVLIPMEPRRPGCNVTAGKDINEEKVKALATAAEECWDAIMRKNLVAFASAFKASFIAQVAMFPGMIRPCGQDGHTPDEVHIQDTIDSYACIDGVLAWKLAGAGGGGYLALVVKDSSRFVLEHAEAISLCIRRK